MTDDGRVISYPALELCQHEDEELLCAIGELLYPGFVRRTPDENGLRLWVEGSKPEADSRNVAKSKFRVLLGALRSWRVGAGELQVERLDGLGPSAARDDDGNQWLAIPTALIYDLAGDPHLTFGRDVATAVSQSVHLTNAFFVNGRTSRTATDFYMIHEYAEREFNGVKGIRSELGLSLTSQRLLTQSANNLSPHDGGRHADPAGSARWSLGQQQTHVSDLLQRWVYCLARSEHPHERPYARSRS